jgi:hypothetical protein
VRDIRIYCTSDCFKLVRYEPQMLPRSRCNSNAPDVPGTEIALPFNGDNVEKRKMLLHFLNTNSLKI